jgi:catechol 2,3-dioxygenase-like lactoylglutathione lyase family enzyme
VLDDDGADRGTQKRINIRVCAIRACVQATSRASEQLSTIDLKGVTMFATRIQLALNVDDVTAAAAFYEKLFGVPPHKVRDGYANFAIEDPPLKLVLIEKPGADERLNHLGVEAATAEHVTEALQRFQAAGLETTVAEQDVCCHATQDKVFVTAPDVPLGWWEFYSITDDNPANPENATASVCAASCAAQDNAESACCA